MVDLSLMNNVDGFIKKTSNFNDKPKKKKANRRSEYFSKLQIPLEMALREVTVSTFATKRWIKLCLSYVEFVSPSESSREPARLMRLLSDYPCGLKREEMLANFYDQYPSASVQRQESFRICLEKIVQRARTTFSKYDLTIHYCKDAKRYVILPLFISESGENSK
jgi:hypothetical protein